MRTHDTHQVLTNQIQVKGGVAGDVQRLPNAYDSPRDQPG